MTSKIRTTPQNGMWVLLDTFSTSCSPISSMLGSLVVTRTRGMVLGVVSGHYWPALILPESKRHGSHNGSKATTCFDILPRWYNRRMKRGRNSSVGMKKHKKTLCSRID